MFAVNLQMEQFVDIQIFLFVWFPLRNMPICLPSNGLYCVIFHRMKWDSLFTFACWFLMFCPRRIMCPVHMLMFFVMDIVIKSIVSIIS